MMTAQYPHLKERLMFYSNPTGMRWRVWYQADVGWSVWILGADGEPTWDSEIRYEVEPISTPVSYQPRIQVPTPERAAPPWGTEYYIPAGEGVFALEWHGSEFDKQILSDGRVYLTEENAESRRQAWFVLEDE